VIYNLGDTVPLSWVNGTDLGPATLAVTDPSGSVTTTSNVTASGGTYYGSYTPTAAGLFTVLWTASTTATHGAYEDVFEVRPNAPQALISIADARESLRLRTADVADNAKIQTIIEAASRLIVDITGPMSYQTYTEWYDGGVSTIVPEHLPLVQVTAAAEYYGLSKFVLTEQPLGAQTDAFAFTVDYSTGQITRRTYGGAPAMFAIGSKNVNIQYQAGRLLVPENVQLACRELVRHFYTQTQVPGRPKFNGAPGEDEFDNRLIGYALPHFVVEMLQPDRRAPGIA
jgi:hypothetical protein